MHNPPILQVVGYKNSGKTTLVRNMLRYLTSRCGWRIATIKHDHAQFELDHRGSDTWQHRQAGSALTLIHSPDQLGLTMRVEQAHSLQRLVDIIGLLGTYDAILVEGYKQEHFPKVVLLRSEHDLELIDRLSHILAVVVQHPLSDRAQRMIQDQGVRLFRRDQEADLLFDLLNYLQATRGDKNETL